MICQTKPTLLCYNFARDKSERKNYEKLPDSDGANDKKTLFGTSLVMIM